MLFPFESTILLENNRVRLTPIQEGDVEHLLNVATEHHDLLQYSPEPIYNRDLLSQYISMALEERNQKKRYTFLVRDKATNKEAGCTSFLNISNKDKRLEIGATWYGKAFHGSGLNANCKLLLLEYAFEILNVERVEFKTDERNKASRKAIEKIGGKYEGTLRNHTLLYDGHRRNTVYYSILQKEWEQVKSHLLNTI